MYIKTDGVADDADMGVEMAKELTDCTQNVFGNGKCLCKSDIAYFCKQM